MERRGCSQFLECPFLAWQFWIYFIFCLTAALFLAFIKAFINDVPDKLAAARRWVPLLIGVMAGAFAAYLSMKGLKRIVTIELGQSLIVDGGITSAYTTPE